MAATATAFTTVGGAAAGIIVDRAGGVPWAFLFSAIVAAAVAVLAALPSGPLARPAP